MQKHCSADWVGPIQEENQSSKNREKFTETTITFSLSLCVTAGFLKLPQNPVLTFGHLSDFFIYLFSLFIINDCLRWPEYLFIYLFYCSFVSHEYFGAFLFCLKLCVYFPTYCRNNKYIIRTLMTEGLLKRRWWIQNKDK